MDKCSSYVDGSISPTQDRNFKVSCSNCRDVSQPLEYDKYTITIVDANFVRPEKWGLKTRVRDKVPASRTQERVAQRAR